MRLKLKELDAVVKEAVRDEKAYAAFRNEVIRVLGPAADIAERIDRFADFANDRLDVLEATSRPVSPARASVLLEVANSQHASVRKLAARLLPTRYASRFLMDSSSSVRCAAAQRLPYSLVKESVKRFPLDDQLKSISRAKRRLDEAGLAKPKEDDKEFDMYGDGPLTAAKQDAGDDDITDGWYKRTARKLCREYGTNIEGQWEEILATRVAASTYATSGVSIDRDKLLKSIYDCLKEREEVVLGEGSLSGLVARLRKDAFLDESVFPVIEESSNPVTDLLTSSLSSSAFVEAAEKVFSVRKSNVPAGIKKYHIGEGANRTTAVPVLGRLPVGLSLDASTERALDVYVESWNKQQAMSGEPYVLSWTPHPASHDAIGFNVTLK